MNSALYRLPLRVTPMITKRNTHSLSSIEIQEYFQEKNNIEKKPKMDMRNFNLKIENENENKNKNENKKSN